VSFLSLHYFSRSKFDSYLEWNGAVVIFYFDILLDDGHFWFSFFLYQFLV